MRLVALSEIEGLEDGEVIPSLTGHIKSVFDYKTGENENGAWSFQDLVITDGKTDVRVKAVNVHNLDDLKGKDVTLTAHSSPKHGLTGIKKLVEEWKGKTYHKVKLTGTCQITTNGEPPDEIPINGPMEVKLMPKGLDNGVDQARHHLMQSANLLNLCIDAVDAVIKPNVEGITAEMYQACSMSLFIEASRSGLIPKMPTTNAKPVKQKNLPF
jgi:hypothetical protein